MSDKSNALVEHYHRTYDVAYKLWEQRNRSFLLLVGLLLVAALFTNELALTGRPSQVPASTVREARSSEGPNFVITLLCAQASQCSDERLRELKSAFPSDTFNLGVSLLVFYLMMNMFAHSNNISRYYGYIVRLEDEIRDELGITVGVAFTREGKFAAHRSKLGILVGYFYWLVLAGLLILHFGSRIRGEWGEATMGLWAHAVIGLLTGTLFVGYVLNSLGVRSRQTANAPERSGEAA